MLESKNTKNKLLCSVSLIFFMLSISVYGSEKYAGEFLSMGVGARALGMGGSFVAVADDATASYWNPAGIGGLDRTELTFMHTGIYGLDKYDFINVVHPFGQFGTFGISWIRLGIDDIPMTQLANAGAMSASNRPFISGYMQDIENAFLLSYGKKTKFLNETDVQLGGNFKFIYNSISGANRNALGFGGDLGLIWRASSLSKSDKPLSADISFGLTAQDFFKTRLFWNTTSTPSHIDIIKPNIKSGVAYYQNIKSISSQIILSVDANTRYGLEMCYGLEYIIAELLAIRVGLQGHDFSAGAGLNIGFKKGDSLLSFIVDYAFLSHELGNSHRISIMTKF